MIFLELTWLYILYKTKEQIKFLYASTNKKLVQYKAEWFEILKSLINFICLFLALWHDGSTLGKTRWRGTQGVHHEEVQPGWDHPPPHPWCKSCPTSAITPRTVSINFLSLSIFLKTFYTVHFRKKTTQKHTYLFYPFVCQVCILHKSYVWFIVCKLVRVLLCYLLSEKI